MRGCWRRLGKCCCKTSLLAERTQPGDSIRVEQRGQGNFELATNCDYIHLGQLTQAKVSVSVGFQNLP